MPFGSAETMNSNSDGSIRNVYRYRCVWILHQKYLRRKRNIRSSQMVRHPKTHSKFHHLLDYFVVISKPFLCRRRTHVTHRHLGVQANLTIEPFRCVQVFIVWTWTPLSFFDLHSNCTFWPVRPLFWPKLYFTVINRNYMISLLAPRGWAALNTERPLRSPIAPCHS